MKNIFLSVFMLLAVIKSNGQTHTQHPLYDSTYRMSYVFTQPVFYKKDDRNPVNRLCIQYPESITWLLKDTLGNTVGSGTLNIRNILGQLGNVQAAIFNNLFDNIILDYKNDPILNINE